MAQQKPTQPKPSDPSDFIYPPSRAISVSLNEYGRRISQGGYLTWGIPGIDARMIPAVGGDLISLLGRPGMSKTMLLITLAKRFNHLLMTNVITNPNPDAKKKVVVYATWETLVEEFVGLFSGPQTGVTLEMIGRGQVNLKSLEAALIPVLGSHLIIFGRSMQNVENPNPPNLLDLDNALYKLREMGLEVSVLLGDYLQRIPAYKSGYSRNQNDTTSIVKDNLDYFKNIAQRYGCPGYMAVQASRDVDNYGGLKFPQMGDGQWSSNIEQTSDKAFGLTMPAKYMEVGSEIRVNGWIYEVKPTTVCLRMWKQRFGSCDNSDVWVMELDPLTMTIIPQLILREDIPSNNDPAF